MSPQDLLIIAAAVLDLVFLIVLVVVGLRFRALANEGARVTRPLVERARRIAGTGQRLATTARTRGETMRQVVTSVAEHVSARIDTTRRLAQEITHPDTRALDTVGRTVEQGRAWSARLSRLGAAARRASGADGRSRRPV